MIWGVTENTLEQTALDWFKSLGWQTAFGPDISLDLFWHASKRQAGIPDAEKFVEPACALHADRDASV